jgi:hypothetical protein
LQQIFLVSLLDFQFYYAFFDHRGRKFGLDGI